MIKYKIDETSEIQDFFQSLKNIDDYVVVEYVLDSTKLLLAYVVAATFVNQNDIMLQVPATLKINAIVQVSRIPKNTEGNVAIEKLLKCEIIDLNLLNNLNQKYNNYDSSLGAAFITEPKVIKSEHYHLYDLLLTNSLENKHHTQTDTKSNKITADIIERPSLSNGGPLQNNPDAPQTLTEALLKTAHDFGKDRGITYVDEYGEEEFQSYAKLLSDAKRILSGLLNKNFKPGDRAILQLTKFSDHFAAFWACVLGGIVPVTVAVSSSYREANSVTDKLINTWNHLKQPVILTNKFLEDELNYLKNSKNLNNFNVVAIDDFYECVEVSDAKIYKSNPNDIIFYQLTSGSTGTPKCIQEKHTSIISHIIGSKIFNNYNDTEITLNWLPLDHVVPILTFHLRDVYLGYNQIMVRTMRVISQPLRWLDLLEKYKVTLSWAPNFGFKLVSDKLLENTNSKKWDLSSIHYLMNAGEQVTSFVMDEFYSLTKEYGIKEKMLQPAFGMAEVCTCMTYNNNYSKNLGSNTFLKSSLSGKLKYAEQNDDSCVSFVDLGPPIPGVEIRIADDNNTMLNEGYIGRFQIRGNVVTPGYLYNDAANHAAFVGDGWFNTGDVGFILNGNLSLTGREKEIIIIRGANYYCYEIEDCVNSIEGVQPTYVAATSALNKKTGTEELAIFFVYKNNSSLNLTVVIKNIKQKINKNFALDAAYVIPLELELFPKTTSGKIQRGQLKSQLAEGKFNEQLKQIEILTASKNTLPNWFFNIQWVADNYTKKSASLTNSKSCIIVFYHESELANNFIDNISYRKLIKVTFGDDFKKLSDDAFLINPVEFKDYLKVLEEVQNNGWVISEIVNFYLHVAFKDIYNDPKLVAELFDKDFTVVKIFLQSIIQCNLAKNDLKIILISSFLQNVSENDKVDPQKSLILGLVNSITNEHDWIKCCNIDLEFNLDKKEAMTSINILINELDSVISEREIAYRNGVRYTPSIIHSSLDMSPNRQNLLKTNATYLISGGMGGIGQVITELLLQNYNSMVIVIGSKKKSEINQEHLDALSKLGNFEYHCVDITDYNQITSFKKEFIDPRNLHLNGILHLAGIYNESTIANLPHDDPGAIIRVKTLGALYLNLVFSDPTCFFTSFSSVTASFGGALISEYSAANRFLDSYSKYLAKSGKESRCIEWCIWDNIGVSKDYPGTQILNAKGFSLINISDGVFSFEVLMSQKFDTMIVGIDSTKIFVRSKVLEDDCSVEQLVAVCTSDEIAKIIKTDRIVDMLGNIIDASEAVLGNSKLESLVTSQDLIQAFKNQNSNIAMVLPSGELETMVSKIFQEYLNLKVVNANSNFFDLGANSVLLMAICDDINNSLHLKLSLVEMFKYSSVKKLCDFIETNSNSSKTTVNMPQKPVRRRIFKDRNSKHDHR